MNTLFIRNVIFSFVLVFGSHATGWAGSFHEGEKLVYDIEWLGLNVGQGRMEVKAREAYKDQEVFRIESVTKSNKFISFFFTVEDRVETIIDAKDFYSYKLSVKQRHGPRRVKKVIYFDQKNHEATLNYKNKENTYEIPPEVKDSLSSLYFFRTIPNLVIGESVFIDVHASKKNWLLEIEILKRERISVPVGTFDTIKVKAKVHFEGVLMDKGDVYMWLTDDERRIPVRINADIALGSIMASLTSLSLPDLLASPARD